MSGIEQQKLNFEEAPDKTSSVIEEDVVRRKYSAGEPLTAEENRILQNIREEEIRDSKDSWVH